jgi:hypothetical protein
MLTPAEFMRGHRSPEMDPAEKRISPHRQTPFSVTAGKAATYPGHHQLCNHFGSDSPRLAIHRLSCTPRSRQWSMYHAR